MTIRSHGQVGEGVIYSEALSPAHRFLALTVRAVRTAAETDELVHLLRELGTAQCLEAARANQVLPLVASALSNVAAACAVSPEWSEAARQNLERVLRLEASLVGVMRSLENAGCRPALIENGGVLYGTELPRAAFCAGDFDILVDRSNWTGVLHAFELEGFWPKARRNHSTERREYCRTLEDGTTQWLNATSVPFDRVWLPFEYNDRISIWLDRRIRSRKFPELFVLAPEDALALVSIHTSLHSFVRAPGIRLHVDVDRIVTDNAINWEWYIQEVRALNLPTRAFVSLAMASGLLGTSIPQAPFIALHPGSSRWRRIRDLLSAEGTFHVPSGRKLARMRAIELDVLLAERDLATWLQNVLFPPRHWMQDHYGSGHTRPQSLTFLYMKRFLLALRAWNPK